MSHCVSKDLFMDRSKQITLKSNVVCTRLDDNIITVLFNIKLNLKKKKIPIY